MSSATSMAVNLRKANIQIPVSFLLVRQSKRMYHQLVSYSFHMLHIQGTQLRSLYAVISARSTFKLLFSSLSYSTVFIRGFLQDWFRAVNPIKSRHIQDNFTLAYLYQHSARYSFMKLPAKKKMDLRIIRYINHASFFHIPPNLLISQFLIYLRAYSIAQRPTIKYAHAKEKTHTQRQKTK